MLKKDWQKGVLTVLIGIVIWFIPPPGDLKPQAMHILAIFVATIAGSILRPLPLGAVVLIGVGLSGFLKVLKPAQALMGFGNATIWLIVSAFLFSLGFIKTGLGKRIAYKIMTKLGTSTLKLGYTMAFADLVMAPAIPANTARAGGIMFPIVRGLCSAFKSEPDESRNKIGSYLINTSYQADCITSSMFVTAMASNSLAVALAAQTIGVELTWGTWALACSVPGLLALLICPYLVYKLDPPEIKKTPEAPDLAREELRKMGPMSRSEKIVLWTFILALLLWATASFTKLNTAMIALFCVSIMLVGHAFEWKDVLMEKGAWDGLVWMGGFMSLAGGLNKSGFIAWFASAISSHMTGLTPTLAMLVLALVYLYSHYGFASLTAHVSSMYAIFVAVAVANGVPGAFAAIQLGAIGGLFGGLTHYAAGAAPIFYNAGYVDQGKWWKIGFILSVVNIAAYICVGWPWWKLIGLW
jgi:DASS family divalent anion:Na+ symporter